ncbi:multidrug resistance efflux pump [Desulfitobacterium dehalogenans ATCC 51507]|uniref:Multidrug resistance efflux pump n=1 Tax=Desulfitobacterium dehalogenans (strain ATCC 51507 / DSM 9161 / JW/IU-DC1) TaxID=756499 RepID=I4A7X8_DESDJ|nr:HlyD family efflux transporter periplasmic adaptor subunit [Desulfitobacterium dehalogenans]AFM00063.1 multidrug resistance efflux pump [Desulfitobacterium dehalogenans ATCC 51507]
MNMRTLHSGLIFTGLMAMILTAVGCSPTSGLVLEGIVETSIYAHYSEVSGKISQQAVELGQTVKAGDVLAVLDDRNERYALEQLEQTLARKQAILAELKTGADPEALKQSANSVKLAEIANANAQLAQDRTRKDYEDAQVLQKAGALPQAELDKLKYQVDLAEAAVTTAALQLDNARQQMTLLQKGTPQEKIAAAQADVALTEVQIRQTKDNLAKYTLTALQDGTVISRNYLPGNMVSPGFDLIDIASETEKHLVAYLPKEYLPKISYGQNVVIHSGEKEYSGTVSFIDVKAQYTPKDMQTSANKNKESMKIKVNLAPETPLKIGEKAEIVLPD